jgi:hypothetical protein
MWGAVVTAPQAPSKRKRKKETQKEKEKVVAQVSEHARL